MSSDTWGKNDRGLINKNYLTLPNFPLKCAVLSIQAMPLMNEQNNVKGTFIGILGRRRSPLHVRPVTTNLWGRIVQALWGQLL